MVGTDLSRPFDLSIADQDVINRSLQGIRTTLLNPIIMPSERRTTMYIAHWA